MINMEISDLISEEEAKQGCPHVRNIAAALADEEKCQQVFIPEVNRAVELVGRAHKEYKSIEAYKRMLMKVSGGGEFPDGRSSEEWATDAKARLEEARSNLYQVLDGIEAPV